MAVEEDTVVAVVPVAHSSRTFTCGDPECNHVHVLLFDETNAPLAQMVVDDTMLTRWQLALYKNKQENTDGQHSGH